MNKKHIFSFAPYQPDPESELGNYWELLQKTYASDSSQKVEQVFLMLFVYSFHSEKCRKFLEQWIDNVPNISALGKQEFGLFFKASERIMYALSELSVLVLAARADLDEMAPKYHPRVKGGGQNDPVGLYYKKGKLHLYVQHNPHGEEVGNTRWTPIIINQDGSYQASQRPAIIAGDVRGEEFTDAFSGSVGTDNYGQRFAVYTIVGRGRKSFEFTPPNVLVYENSDRDGTFKNKRYPITWLHTFQNSYDYINQEEIKNLYDCRDPFFFEREGKQYILLGATTMPGRIGGGAVALLTSDGEDLTKPWRFIGLAFKQIIPHSELGAGIYECPSISHTDSGLDVLIISRQRRVNEGNLRGFHHHQAVWCWIGQFSPQNGRSWC